MKKLTVLMFTLLVIIADLSAQSWDEMLMVQAPDGASTFAEKVAISGNYAIVGAYSTGTAYIYYRSGGVWYLQATLVPADGTGSFGWSVSIDGDYAVIGAKHYNNHGSAYIFVRSGSTWTEQARLIASDAAQWDYFGTSVSISGEYALIGAPNNDDVWQNSGCAYIFKRTGSVWNQMIKLRADDEDSEDFFGGAVSLSGSNAVIGATGNTVNGINSGCAYTFNGSGASWTQTTRLISSDASSQDEFGHSVSITDLYVLVGAYMDDDNGSRSGSAYVFDRNGGTFGIRVTGTNTYNENTKLLPSDGTAYDYFGFSVAISDDYAVIGAHGDTPNGSRSGSAYIFEKSGTNWPQHSKLIASNSTTNFQFGFATAVSGNCALIGSPNRDSNPGFAYFFEYPIANPDPPQNVAISITGTQIQITWDAVPGATSYKVYSSTDPYSITEEDTTGTLVDTTWTAPIPDVKKFYYVKAVN